MSELDHITNHCQHCGGGIEFPSHGVGLEIECPHCGGQITLVQPPSFSTPLQIEAQPPFRPEAKETELLFLSRFTCPANPDELGRLDHWQQVLGAGTNEVIKRFIQDGLLVETSVDLISRLQTRSSSELKSYANERGLPQSGNKTTLARRLAKSDPTGMEQMFVGKRYFVCTPRGQELAEKFLQQGAEAEQEAKERSLAAVREGRIVEACQIVAKFEASRVFGRGVGVDWQNYDPSRDTNIVRAIFSERLLRHAKFDKQTMANLRVAAAMMQLWGVNNPKPWLEQASQSGIIDWPLEARMLQFRALEMDRLEAMRAAGIRRVEVLGSGDSSDCRVCRSDKNKVYAIGDAPVLPHGECTCESGCGCILIAKE